MVFLFWNTKGANLADHVADLVRVHHVDIVILAEATKGEATYLQSVNGHGGVRFRRAPEVVPSVCRLTVFSPFSQPVLTPIVREEHMAIYAINRPLEEEILAVAVHLPSPMFQSDRALSDLAIRATSTIQRVEADRGHRRTVVIGDFNMNPFHHGMVSSDAFHAVMDRRIAAKEKRVVMRRECHFFYNPMWGRLGDTSPGPSGTYYYSNGVSDCQFWHVWDQVLVRPGLLHRFSDDNFKVLTEINGRSLMTKTGMPDSRKCSDHLPLYFKLNP